MTGTARIYARLSDRSNRSIDGQLEDCQAYADQHGYTVDHTYNEGEGESGWDDTRKEYNQMLTDAENGEFDVLIVRRAHRVGRDHRERIRRLWDLDDWGVELHTCKRGYIDPEKSSDFLMEVFRAMTDDKGKRDEVELLEAEMEKRKERGWYIGEAPTALQYDEDKQYLEATGEIDDVMRVFEMRDEGATYREIAEEVPWSHVTVGTLIERREEYEAVADGARLGYELEIVDQTPA